MEKKCNFDCNIPDSSDSCNLKCSECPSYFENCSNCFKADECEINRQNEE